MPIARRVASNGARRRRPPPERDLVRSGRAIYPQAHVNERFTHPSVRPPAPRSWARRRSSESTHRCSFNTEHVLLVCLPLERA